MLRDVVHDDLGVREHALDSRFRFRLGIPIAAMNLGAGNVDRLHGEAVQFAGLAGLGMEGQDVHHFLFVHHPLEVAVEVVCILEDCAAGRIGEEVQPIIRNRAQSRITVAVDPDAGDVDGVHHHVGLFEELHHLFEDVQAGRVAEARVVVGEVRLS